MRLIVTEKNNSARKIAQILSGGTMSEDASFRTPHYAWTDAAGTEHMTIGLKGHMMNPAFPEGLDNWQKTDPRALIDADLVKEPTDKNVLKAVLKVAKQADELVIATDFDREGELIGLEVFDEILAVNPGLADGAIDARSGRAEVQRARYSALTQQEIERAFANLDTLSFDLAHAGAARQDIDLIWGATLTRAVSLATRRFGSNFLSVGRVQSPTLGLIVERELERRAHVAVPFWELSASFEHADGSFEARHKTDKFWDQAEAQAALEGTTSPGTVAEVSKRRSTRKPPAPFNTTSFTTEASSRLGITPARAMRLAEDLYMDGFISYPRTDNTVYPPSLNTRELVASLVKVPAFSGAKGLLDGELTATRGKKETTDHPPIHPTQAVFPAQLEGPKGRIYELVVRRFLATFMAPMISEGTRADISAGSETYVVRGSVVVDPGFGAVYTYARSKDNEIPALQEGQQLALDGEPRMEGKETQPPSRYSQGKLIELMEERDLGTKATRADIIQKLYGRGYVYNNPPEPSETGIAMYLAFKRHSPSMATPEMTAELESDMDKIASGEATREEVLAESRRMLHQTYGGIETSREDLAKEIWAGMDLDRILGPCKVCEDRGRTQEDGSPNMLRIIKARKSGKRFVGCSGWSPDDPDACDQTFPLPQRGDLFRLEARCTICEQTPRVKVMPFRGRPWNLCLNDDCPSMVEMRAKRAERQAAREAKEAAAEADTATGGNGGGNGAGTKERVGSTGKRAAAGKGASGRTARKRTPAKAKKRPASKT